MMRIESVGVVGLGAMGAGIAEVFARGGYRVVGVETRAELAERGRGILETSTAKAVAKGKLAGDEREALLGRVEVGSDLADLADVDLVVEAVPEVMDIKHQTFARLDEVTKPEAILASNTSSLSITEIAAGTQRPRRVVGMHFFNPAPVLRLVEVIHTATTDADALEAVRRVAEDLGKAPVVVKDQAGFIANNLLFGYMNRAAQLYFRGDASAQDIDAAMRVGVGLPMGPLTLMDMVGLDVCNDIGQVIYSLTHKSMHAPSAQLDTMVTAGLLGRKSGAGFYDYGSAGQASDDAEPGNVPAVRSRPVSSIGVIGAGERANELSAMFEHAEFDVVRITDPAGSLQDLAGVDLVIEAADVVDQEGIPQGWFGEEALPEAAQEEQPSDGPADGLIDLGRLFLDLSAVMRADTVVVSFAADTTLEVAAVTGRRDAAVRAVLHEATPAGRVVEFGRCVATSSEVELTLRQVFSAAGLTPVILQDQPGLIIEGLLAPQLNEAVLMQASGYASMEDIDTAMVQGCGYPMGPFAMLDLLGAERVLQVMEELQDATSDPGLVPAPGLVDRATLDLPFRS